jgi:hypothetical protein
MIEHSPGFAIPDKVTDLVKFNQIPQIPLGVWVSVQICLFLVSVENNRRCVCPPDLYLKCGIGTEKPSGAKCLLTRQNTINGSVRSCRDVAGL